MKSHRSRFISIHTFVLIFILLPFISTAQIIHTERADATFDVNANEAAVFTVTDTAGGDFLGGNLSYEIYLDAIGKGLEYKTLIKLDSGVVNVPYQGTKSISFTYNEPGVISCRIITGENEQDPVASAAFSPFEIKQLEEEGDFLDFDGFWATAKSQLANVPMGIPEPLIEYPDTFNESTSYRINLGNINGRKVYGFLTVPNSSSKYGTGPFPAMVQLPPFGDNLFHPNFTPNAAEITGIIHLSISIHNTEPDILDSNAYLPKDNLEFADSNYYKQAVLAGVRAIDYLYTRSDIDTSRVGVMGVSQGGGLAVMVAGIDERVNYLMASNPAGSEHLGKKYDKATGFPKFLYEQENLKPNATEYVQQQWLKNVKYYDILNFAKRYDGPASIFVGYEDLTCPARGTFALFNTLKGPKILAHEINQGHNHGVYSNTFPTWIARHFNTEAEFAFGAKGYYINLGVDKDVPFGKKVALEAIVEHDHFAYTADFTFEWTQVSGPGNVTFSNDNKKTSNATFSQTGLYKLQFKAVDKSQLDSNYYYFTLIDEIEINVVEPSQCVDYDEDGICASSDCDDMDPLVPNLPGKRCNDYDTLTTREVFLADNCNCGNGISRILMTTACDDAASIVYGAGKIEITGQNGKLLQAKIFKSSDVNSQAPQNEVYNNNSGPLNYIPVTGLSEGEHVVFLWENTIPDWHILCSFKIYVSIPLSQDNQIIDPDNDNDSIPASQDWDDHDNTISSFNSGDTCIDGDPNTSGDYYRVDGFTCAGNYVDPCPTSGGDADKDGVCDNNDCNPNDPNFPKEINTPCDDGDFNTKNDVYIDGCTCQGVPLDSTNTGGGTNPSNTLWTLSNDGNYIYREGRTVATEFRAEKLMVEANLSANNLLEGSNNVMPLEQLRGYIEQNKHLPNIPKAATIINSGLNVGLLSVLRMQKIKELTLYLLEMNERLEEMEKENKGLEKLENEFNDCDNVVVTGGSGEITISGFSPIYQVEIYDNNWTLLSSCTSTDGNCTSPFSIGQGVYKVKVKLYTSSWGWICEKQVDGVNVTSGGGGNSNPCDGQGGDTDGDGVCDPVDACPGFDDNIDTNNDGTPDGCENTGGGNTGGGSTTSGNESCENFNINTDATSITISGMNDPTTKLAYKNGASTNWVFAEECNGNCGSSRTITGLTSGDQVVIQAQTFSGYCYKEYPVVTVGSGNNSGGGNNGGGTQQDTTTIGLWTANNTEDYIFRNGKVMVMDTFMAEKIIVEVINWPDYVFDKEYDLLPLNKLQQYISTNKHLPNIPKGEVIEKDGMNIGDISVLQMEKIEELTLYLLEMNKRLEQLERKRK